MTFRTRFAPSPTGPLHLGHAYSAILAHDMAMANAGDFLLRIEDIDQSRARPEWEDQIYDDLRWLGLSWEKPVLRQSNNFHAYAAALDKLWVKGLLYPCTCSRADIKAATSAPQEGVPQHGPDGLIYPGTCNEMSMERTFPDWYARPMGTTLRLDMTMAVYLADFQSRIEDPVARVAYLGFHETGASPTGQRRLVEFEREFLPRTAGDIVLARKDMGTSYHLSVVIDDAAQGVTDVVRGDDLQGATAIHVLLQKLLGYPTPVFHHHKLIRDENGKRLAKRDDARAIRKYREDGYTPADIRTMVGL